jgi:hypothetical protein
MLAWTREGVPLRLIHTLGPAKTCAKQFSTLVPAILFGLSALLDEGAFIFDGRRKSANSTGVKIVEWGVGLSGSQTSFR